MFQVDFQVRDYECDAQGIVNNAVYQNYFEHARHLFFQQKGINFMEITQQGIWVVVYRAEIDYLIPLTHSNSFQVGVEFERLSKASGLFNQNISIKNDIFTRGKFYIAALNANKKPINLDKLGIQ